MDDKILTRAKNAAYRLLTYRPRSRAELRSKLKDKEYDDAIIKAVLEHLDRLGYLNDREFARQWAAARIRARGFGRRRIEKELRNKGIEPEIVREILSEMLPDDTELATAMQQASKKLKTLSRFDHDVRRRRLAGHLERKGFPPSVIRDVLRNVSREEMLLD